MDARPIKGHYWQLIVASTLLAAWVGFLLMMALSG